MTTVKTTVTLELDTEDGAGTTLEIEVEGDFDGDELDDVRYTDDPRIGEPERETIDRWLQEAYAKQQGFRNRDEWQFACAAREERWLDRSTPR